MKLLTSAVFILCFTYSVMGCKSGSSIDRISHEVKKVKVLKTSGAGGETDLNRDTGRSKLIKPANFRPAKPLKKIFKSKYMEIHLYARKFAQGNAVYVEVLRKKYGDDFTLGSLRFNNKTVPLTEVAWGYRGFIGIGPELKPGYKKFRLNYYVNDKERILNRLIFIKDTKFPVSKRRLNLGKFSDKKYYTDPKFRDLIKRSAKLKREAFRSDSEDKIINTLAHPRDFHKITSPFWKKRVYLTYYRKNNKKRSKGRVRIHRGLDFKGKEGAHVFSMAHGKVVLSSKLFYEGNMVIIDHGSKIFSYYMHMKSLGVNTGDTVSAGDFIGTVGSTGMSTASHLHVSVKIRGVQVDPLSFLCLPVRK